jgi:PBP1b-binding outer membrane lipoprotein LpoB
MKLFKYLIIVIIALVAVGCESMDVGVDDMPSNPDKPTVPIKKRPIVPTTKLPRPRIVEDLNVSIEEYAGGGMEWTRSEEE